MAGEISADYSSIDYGVNYSSMFRNSLEFGDIKVFLILIFLILSLYIKNNSCIMVQFRDPQFPPHFQFKACRLDGIKELPRALKPQNYDDRRQGPYRPLIGFSRDVPRASLSTSGHRTLNHHVTHRDRRSGPSSLFCYQSQHIQTSPQTLPWHSNSAQQQYQIPFNNLQQPVPLNFMQLAMPPPPIPPQNWVSPPPQQHSYIGQWGQPPVQPQQYNNQRNNNESWRR